jgi:hypothetical protein
MRSFETINFCMTIRDLREEYEKPCEVSHADFLRASDIILKSAIVRSMVSHVFVSFTRV